MSIDTTASPRKVLRSYELLINAFAGYSTKVDIIRQNLQVLSTDWQFNTELTDFTYEGLTASGDLHIYSIDKPADFAHDANNAMYFSVYEFSYFATTYLGEITSETGIQLSDVNGLMAWGYGTEKLFLYIVISGLSDQKYILWLPKDFTAEEEDTFFNKIHSFVLDYKLSA